MIKLYNDTFSKGMVYLAEWREAAKSSFTDYELLNVLMVQLNAYIHTTAIFLELTICILWGLARFHKKILARNQCWVPNSILECSLTYVTDYHILNCRTIGVE